MLSPVPNKLDLPQIDHKMLEFWKEKNILQKSIQRAAVKGDFVFYDGPPGTNGVPHVGHMMQSALKDLWPRYKTMQGYRVLRKAGWDTHGLPIELTADKELGFKSKLDIAAYGEQKYIDYCRKTVFRYKEQWEFAINRIGRFLDLENDYATYQPYYIQSDWWTLKQAWNLELEGEARERALRLGQSPKYLYRDYRVMAYSPRTGTTLSNFEVAQGYEEVTDLTLYVKFRLKEDKNTFLTAWTTTPWTLLSNLAVAAGGNITYVVIELLEDSMAGKQGERLILAEARLEALTTMLGKYKTVSSMKGSELEGKAYEPLFDWLNSDSKTSHRVYCDDYVTTEDGTGLVHLAPYGEDDFRILRKKEVPIVLAVDNNGTVTEMATPFKGREFREEGLDVDILKFLLNKGLILGKEKYTHTYPFDYRTKTPLMYFPRPAWFLRMTALRDMMLEANHHIHWHPDHLRDGRFGNWLENVTDWNITRERFWGSPLPVWQTEDGSESVCIESLTELKELAQRSGVSLPSDFDPHKPQIDSIVLKSASGKPMYRDNFVLDCWFNAGIMPWGQWGYPAEKGSDELFACQYPADFICEGLDQTRGWFYTLLATSTLISKAKWQEAKKNSDKKAEQLWSNPKHWSSYKNVICTELILDSKGQKMSKSLGNVVDPMALFEKFGADPVRWIFYSSNPWNSKRFGEDEIAEAMRMVILPLWNSYSFFVTYAVIDGWNPNQSQKIEPTLLDKWIISEYNRLVDEVVKALDDYDVATAATSVTRFLDLLTNWYIRRSRRRFWKSESDSDKATAYATLHEVLIGLTSLLAPFLPFLSEYMYQNLVLAFDKSKPESVHLSHYPVADSKQRDLILEEQMDRLLKAVTLARALRQERNLKVRQPLASMTWVIPDSSQDRHVAPFLQMLADELNVKAVNFRHDDSDLVTLTCTANFKVLGKKVGGKMKEVAAILAELSQTEIKAILSGKNFKHGEFEFTSEDIQIKRNEQEGLVLNSDGYMTVALDTHITEELEAEGNAREVVHHIQNLRKSSGLEITDRIRVEISTDSSTFANALKTFDDYIRKETLAQEFELKSSVKGTELEANGHQFNIWIEKIASPSSSKNLINA